MAPCVLRSEFIAIYMRRCLCRMSSQSSKVSVIKPESGSRCFKDPFKDSSDVDKTDYQTRKCVGLCAPLVFTLHFGSMLLSSEARKPLFPTLQTSDVKAEMKILSHCSVKPVRVQYRVIIKKIR